jgi:hypothetical protein
MTHPIIPSEAEYLTSEEFEGVLQNLDASGYAVV